jgi:hypothetical protein
MKLHLFAHNSKNLVKKGDKVKAYDQWIGEIGNANGVYYAHLHYSISEGLTPTQIKSYVNGWSIAQVKKYYSEPKVNRSKMFEKPVDNGERGYGWLQRIANGSPHPGIDYNGLGGGNTDYGYKFKSPIDGVVEYVGDWKNGWGLVIIIKEEQMREELDDNIVKLLKTIKENIEDFGDRMNSNERKRIEKKIKSIDLLEKSNEALNYQISLLKEGKGKIEDFYHREIDKKDKLEKENKELKERLKKATSNQKAETILDRIKSLLNLK